MGVEDTVHEETGTEVQYVTFFLGRDMFGIEVLRVQEILQSQEITPAPLAPEYIMGLINLRGQIITAMDLKMFVTGERSSENTSQMNIVIKDKSSIVSMVVDEIGDVIDIQKKCIEPLPAKLATINQDYISGICKRETEIVILLNVDQLLGVRKVA